MFKHYLLLAWRNIIRQKFYSLILISGFAIGLAASIILFMYVADELSYDSFHEKKDRIFLVGVENESENEESYSGWTTPPTGPALQEYFPEIETNARICFWFDEVMVTNNETQYVENKIIGADSTIFDVFDIPFVIGNPETALVEPNAIVLTEAAAKKYFGDENSIGKALQFDEFFNNCVVTGIVKDYPDNSHFDFEILLSLKSLQTINFNFNDSWDNHTFSTYVLLNEHADPFTVESKFPSFLKAKL